MERAEKVKKKLRSLEYPPLNPKDPWGLVDKLLNDLLKASEGYQFVKMKMRELKQELENRGPQGTQARVEELQRDNDQLHIFLIERDKEIAMLNFQKRDLGGSVEIKKGADMFEGDVKSEPGLDREKRKLEFDEFVKVCNSYQAEVMRLRMAYEGRPRMSKGAQNPQEEQRKRVLENQIEYLTTRNQQLEEELFRCKEEAEESKQRERNLAAEKQTLRTRLLELENRIERQTQEIGQEMESVERESRLDEQREAALKVELESLEGQLRLMAKDVQEKNDLLEARDSEIGLMRKETEVKDKIIGKMEQKLGEAGREEERERAEKQRAELKVRELEQEVELVRKSLQRGEADGRKHETDLRQMRERVRELVRENGEKQLEIRKKEMEMEVLRREKEGEERKVADLRKEIEEVEERGRRDIAELVEGRGEDRFKREREDELRREQEERRRAEEEAAGVRRELGQAKRALAEMEREWGREKEEKQREMQVHDGRRKQEQEHMQKQLENVLEEKEMKMSDLESRFKSLSQAESQQSTQIRDLITTNAKLDQEKRVMEEDLRQMEKNLQSQAQQNFKIESEKFELQNQIKEIQQERNEYEKRCKELIERSRQREGEIRPDADKWRRELEKERGEGERVRQREAELRAKLREMDLQRDRLEEDLDAKTENLEEIQHEMKTLIKAYEERMGEIEVLNRQLGDLEGQVAREREQSRRVQDKDHHRNSQLEDLRKGREHEKAMRIELEGDLQILNRENKKLANGVFAMERKLQMVERKQEETQANKQILEAELEMVKVDAAQLAKTCKRRGNTRQAAGTRKPNAISGEKQLAGETDRRRGPEERNAAVPEERRGAELAHGPLEAVDLEGTLGFAGRVRPAAHRVQKRRNREARDEGPHREDAPRAARTDQAAARGGPTAGGQGADHRRNGERLRPPARQFQTDPAEKRGAE